MRTVLLTMALALLHGTVAAEPPAVQPAYDSAFAGYQPYREPVVKLAGRDRVVPAQPAARPAGAHAGHAMHQPTPATAPDPHAGHGQQPATSPAAKPAQEAHEGHEHQHHQQ